MRIVLIGLQVVFCISFSIGQEWELAKDQDGIIVYTKDSETSKFKAFKAITVFECKALSVLYGILKDSERIPEWVTDIESIEIIKRIGTDRTIEYHKVAVPWPFSDRDLVLETSYVFDGEKSFTKTVDQKLDVVELDEDYVRITTLSGYWLFEQINNEEIKLTYEILADPAGNLPAWVVNMFIVDGPHETLTNLHKMVAKAQSN
ncbi:MAG: hypothetical protein HRT72_13540 [Flavobacteriales bacterium]|nr:hypothetical protein [Flavobacteriales bacterium]